MAFLVATTSLPAVYRPNGYARMTTAGTPHARANIVRPHYSASGETAPLNTMYLHPSYDTIPCINTLFMIQYHVFKPLL